MTNTVHFMNNPNLRSTKDLLDPCVDMLNADLKGLHPACLIAEGLDPFRDDSVAFAALLEKAGVASELKIHEAVMHGFLHYSRMLDPSITAFEQGSDFL